MQDDKAPLKDELEVEFVDGDDIDTILAEAEAQEAKGKNDAKADAPAETRPDSKDDQEDIRAELARERAARARAEQERDEVAQRSKAETTQAEIRANAAQRESAQSLLQRFDIQIKAAREAVKLAKAEGKEDVAWEAQDMLDELRANRNRLETEVISKLPTDEEMQARARAAVQQASQRQQPQSPQARNSLAQQWAAANPAVMADPRTSHAVSLLSQEIHREGLDPSDPAHFAELTKRLSAALPKAGIRGIGGPAKASAAPVAGRSQAAGAAKPSSNPNKVTLDAKDLLTMRRYKLDPKDPKARQYYAREKRELQLQDQRRGA